MRSNFIVLLFLCLLFLPSCYVLTAYKYRHFKLESLSALPSVPLEKSQEPFHFIEATANYPRLKHSLDSILAPTPTYSFLVIRNDSILYEKYFGDVQPGTQLPSFSVAKSFVATLVGIAYEEGKIKSLREPITHYLPELKKRDPAFEKITIQHLLDMRSGIKSVENYDSPFSNVIKLGFAKNITKHTLNIKIEKAPGEYAYKSLNTQLLALIVERATQRKLQDYLVDKIWKPLQMESEATWNTDKRKTVRAFCCINATTRDFAKFGRLYLRKGNWDGKQIVSEDWVRASTSVDTMRRYEGYRNQWWSNASSRYFMDSIQAAAYQQKLAFPSSLRRYIPRDGKNVMFRVVYRTPAFHAEGILNQYVYVNPLKNVVIVRMGYHWGNSSFSPNGLLYWLGDRL